MKTLTYTTIDRSAWPSGEWDSEPDKVQWKDMATGLPCLAVRNQHMGHWCGYVGVAPGHPQYEMGGCELDVHGGVNFAAMCAPGEPVETGVCHIAEPGEPEHVWWLGFDCAHAFDLVPFMSDTLRLGGIYRTLDYVQAECRSLALQLAQEMKT
jgi:hypothetical protein